MNDDHCVVCSHEEHGNIEREREKLEFLQAGPTSNSTVFLVCFRDKSPQGKERKLEPGSLGGVPCEDALCNYSSLPIHLVLAEKRHELVLPPPFCIHVSHPNGRLGTIWILQSLTLPSQTLSDLLHPSDTGGLLMSDVNSTLERAAQLSSSSYALLICRLCHSHRNCFCCSRTST